jgi:uncharacterized protein (DUF1810 family)
MIDPYHLQLFVDAQDPVFEQVREELCDGCKTGHWIWFIFPQINGLFRSSMTLFAHVSTENQAFKEALNK